MSAVLDHTCPDCHGKGGALPNGVKYCNCPETNGRSQMKHNLSVATVNGVPVNERAPSERERLVITREALIALGNFKIAEIRRLQGQADDAFEQAERIKEQLEVVR